MQNKRIAIISISNDIGGGLGKVTTDLANTLVKSNIVLRLEVLQGETQLPYEHDTKIELKTTVKIKYIHQAKLSSFKSI